MSAADHHEDHGHSPANWTMAILVLLGFVVASIGFLPIRLPVIYAGFGLVVVGLIAGIVVNRVTAAKSAE